jgi:hypothetical protein
MDNVSVSSAERDEYSAFCSDIVRPLLSAPPSVVWHYTSGASLINIIRTGALYSTQITCLNDHQEGDFARKLFSFALNELKHRYNSDADYLINYIVEALARNTPYTVPWFITCFSSQRDDLSQWRAYGGGENGYAIGFETAWLVKCGEAHKNILIPVSYEQTLNERFASDLAKATVNFFMSGLSARRGINREDWIPVFLREWGDQISYFEPLLKNSSFKAEGEWRIVRKLSNEDITHMEYVQKSSMLSRHVLLRFPPNESPVSKLLPIKEILVGPSRHKEVSKISVGDLLRTCGYPEQRRVVNVSSIPFQST